MRMTKPVDAGENRRSPAAQAAAYSLAAGAAMNAPTADAAIQYLPEQNIDVLLGQSQPLYVDPDAYTDINLKNYFFAGGYYQGLTIPFAPGRVIGFETNYGGVVDYVSLLSEGDLIGPTTASPSAIPSVDFFGVLSYGANNANDEFDNVTGGLIGFSFPIGGATEADLHYAWMRLDVDNAAGTLRIVEWAYEDVPGEAILAGDTGGSAGDYDGDGDIDVADALEGQRLGEDLTAGSAWNTDFGAGELPIAAFGVVPEPGTLGLLAAGSLGVSAMRRTRRRRV